MSALTQEQLKEVLYFDRQTGDFYWRYGTRNRLPWRRAGTRNAGGYMVINIRGCVMYAHRLAILYVDGVLPPAHTDHRDGNTGRNESTNLRAASPSVNGLNRKSANKNSTSGVRGVSRRGNRFRARLMIDRKEIFLGSYPTESEAKEAVNKALRNHESNP